MKSRSRRSAVRPLLVAALLAGQAAAQVPPEVQLPGTQPLEVAALSEPSQCDNCHGGYDAAVEPAHNWRGSLMAHATIDPLLWATLAVAERDFPGVGDLCLRCHTFDGWLVGNSTPTDGSALEDKDATGVACHLCHLLVDPDDSEHVGVQNWPYLAHDESPEKRAYLGSGMAVLFGQDVRLGPYSDPASPHSAMQSAFHRSAELCGTCHDVSNPVTGDLAHNHGAFAPLPGAFDGTPGGNVDDKAAFNNFPAAYGIVERTYSEHVASRLSETLVDDYDDLPAELQAGAIRVAREAARAVRDDGYYADGTPRRFTCQTCHMPPREGQGCKKPNAPLRADLPLHDMTGGSTWMPDVLLHLDDTGGLRLGGALTADERSGLVDGSARALATLQSAASLSVEGDLVRVVNLTGHKLPTGYPEGRRMWLRVRWLDGLGGLLREDGAYGDLLVDVEGTPTVVRTLLDPDDPHLRRYDAHPGMTQEWAQQLLGFGLAPDLPLEYDRVSGAVVHTLTDLAQMPPGSALETFHFALDNTVLADTRIPPYGMRYDLAHDRNCLPVPEDQYGDPGPGGEYDHRDEWLLEPPATAARAEVALLYQSTSWEYLQFLELAGADGPPTLQDAGETLREAWQATGMAEPVVVAATTWVSDCDGNGVPDDQDLAAGAPDCNANGRLDACDIAEGTSVDLDGDGVPDECQVERYCRAKTSAAGCLPAVGHQGTPTLSGPDDFVLTAADVPGQTTGLLIWGLRGNPPGVGPGPGAFGLSPWGGRRCVLDPVPTAPQASGGTAGACDGGFALPFTQADMLALGWSAGTTVHVQWWYDDPAHPDGSGVGHSDALRFTVLP